MNMPSLRDIAVATRQVATKSAMNPVQWICGLTTPASIAAACLSNEPLNYAFLVLAATPVLYALRAYERFMKTDPDRLQSERFLIEQKMVAKIGINGEGGAEIALAPGPNVNNPMLVRKDGI